MNNEFDNLIQNLILKNFFSRCPEGDDLQTVMDKFEAKDPSVQRLWAFDAVPRGDFMDLVWSAHYDLKESLVASRMQFALNPFVSKVLRLQEMNSILTLTFVEEAVKRYAAEVVQSQPWEENGWVSFEAWKTTAQKLLDELK